jgi:iron complex transport system permease protein
VVVGVVLGALASLALLLNPQLLAVMQSFTLGSTAFAGWAACAMMAASLALCLPLAMLLARVLDALALGEATAQSLGLRLPRLRLALVGVLALCTGAAVAQTGLIAFVGLAAPHLVRALIKTTHRWLLLLASLAGGALLTAADLLARAVIAPQELPVGVLTAVLGGGYLLWLLRRQTSGPAQS